MEWRETPIHIHVEYYPSIRLSKVSEETDCTATMGGVSCIAEKEQVGAG